jgi:phage N-6-adenine-methyltransferase
MAERGERRSAGEHSGNQYSERFPSETIPPKLEDLGVTKIQSHRWQKLADLDDEVFEATVEAAKTKMVAAVEGRGTAFRTTFTGYQNWFTPPQYLELAREVLGDFDLDPASHIEAQKVIQAKKFFTAEDDGLSKEWHGRVWLNPPYSSPEVTHFVHKLIDEYKAGRVHEAILLTHNFTDTKWYQKAALISSNICLTLGRINFISLENGEQPGGPSMGQSFMYFGKNSEKFANCIFANWPDCRGLLRAAACSAAGRIGVGPAMTIRALICGSLYRSPERRVSKAGKDFVTATMAVKDGETLSYVRLVAFSNTVQEELLQLHDGAAISVAGPLKAEIYTRESNGETRISLNLVVDQILSLQAKRERKPKEQAEAIFKEKDQPRRTSQWQSEADGPNDDILFRGGAR